MSKATHTPGPWHLLDIKGKEAHVFAGDKYQVADCEHYKRSNAECLANATLVTAAPTMLAALRSLIACIGKNCNWEDGCFYFNERACPELEKPLKDAQEALRKAGVE